MTTAPEVRTEGLRVSYGETLALDGLDLEVRTGEGVLGTIASVLVHRRVRGAG